MITADTYDMLGGVEKMQSVVPVNGVIQVTVRFGEGFPIDMEGSALLEFEKRLRALTGLDVRVFKQRMGDDSKLRIRMTPAERDKL